ncbi:MAG: hypothetical protein QME60_03020 [Verrucomicrobiota bacterium]|nr:hypothetical protein [Verrucomicrobiota bacterium]
MDNTVASVAKHGTEEPADQAKRGQLPVAAGGGFEVEWDTEVKVTPMGSLVCFAQHMETGGLMDRLCRNTPLAYTSPNAPEERDVMGTIVLSALNGQTRYAHINALRGDRVSAEVLRVSKVVRIPVKADTDSGIRPDSCRSVSDAVVHGLRKCPV